MQIYGFEFGAGYLAVSPIPGRHDAYQSDFMIIRDWGPDLVLTMTTQEELDDVAATAFPADLKAAGIEWRHLPISDFGTPPAHVQNQWTDVSAQARAIIAQGGRVLAHCYGGQGRSGMAILRIMVDAGADPTVALAQLRAVRPKAVETDAQMDWATNGMIVRK